MKILFYISKQYSLPIVKPLVDLLQMNEAYSKEIDFAFYISRKVKRVISDEWKVLNLMTDLSEAKDFNPDFVLVPGNFVDFRIPGKKVQIFHGVGLEKTSHFKIRHFFDMYLTSGPAVTDKYLEMQKKYKYFLVKETGFLKFDYILNYDTSDIKEKFEIHKDKKRIILYAPTFSSKMESATDLLDIIPSIIAKDELWLIKFHELMNKELVSEFIEKIKDDSFKDKIKFITGNDIVPYLHIADIMISDTSSVIYEFLSLDKPVITYKTITRKDKGIDISDPSKLRETLDKLFLNPSIVKDGRDRNIKEVNPYLDGKISNRVVEVLLEVYKNDLIPKKGKPFNLFRKLQIMYHSNFKKGYMR